MFYVGEWPKELIICLLEVSKNDFRSFVEAIFQVVKGHANSFSGECALK
jgi:hypothetical protein